ncbi:unnamed protein product [Closterium sp. NIES-64]|nr:unnamed protein product [Closterium sp. NIES-64]
MATPFHFQPLPIPTQSQPSAGNNSFWPTIQQQQTQAASPPSTQPPSSTPAAPPSFAVPSAAPMFPAPTAAPLAAVPSAAPMLPAPHAAGPGSSQALMDALNLLQQKRKVEEIAFDAANAEVGPSHASKKLVPAQNAKVPGGVNGCASIADAGLDEENDEESPLPDGTFDIIEMDPVELLAEHTHFCEICGKGFKRDANLRMHMRGHGDAYKTPEALARPGKHSPEATGQPPKRFSCPFVGCKRNQQHRAFVPLKTMLCVKNHYRRTHCPKMLSCSKCGAKRFSVVADLKTHEKHCGRDRWLCSCGTSFSRKDKLLGHLALFKGHRPANPSLTAAAAPTVADAIAAEAAGAAFLEGTDTFSPNYTGAPPPPPSFPSSVVSFSGKGKQLVQKGMDGGAGEVGPAVSSQSTNVDIGKHSGSGGGSNRCSRIDCFSSNLNLNGAALAQCEGDTEEREVEVVLYRQQPCVQLCIGQVIDVQKSEERE